MLDVIHLQLRLISKLLNLRILLTKRYLFIIINPCLFWRLVNLSDLQFSLIYFGHSGPRFGRLILLNSSYQTSVQFQFQHCNSFKLRLGSRPSPTSLNWYTKYSVQLTSNIQHHTVNRLLSYLQIMSVIIKCIIFIYLFVLLAELFDILLTLFIFNHLV